jgi:hypothetical protein
LTGLHETAKIDQFSSGVAARNCSVRIPRQTHVDGYVRSFLPNIFNGLFNF